MDVQNFGQVPSGDARLRISAKINGRPVDIARGTIPPLAPFEMCSLTLSGDAQLKPVVKQEVTVIIEPNDQLPVTLQTSIGRAPKAGEVEESEPTGERRPTEDLPAPKEMLANYFRQMSIPKPFANRTGQAFENHQAKLRSVLLDLIGLSPLPARIDLDPHQSTLLDHPWCRIRRVHFQLWPGVYTSGLLYMPKKFRETPAPAMLCPHGHWPNGNAEPDVQRRCLNFARLGYVTFSSTQNHYEDLAVGVSNQTLMVWNNMRALDYLEQLPEVDENRIGVAGASGGGLQTQMLVALDPRVKAATIVGLTCDFREIMFPDRNHCVCNHFPRVMQFTDHPEISTLGLPAAVEYLTMNDWTRTFESDNFPAIKELYRTNGFGERVDCRYYDTPHSYDRKKRERTYWWMEKWVRGNHAAKPVIEPDMVPTFPPETLKQLSATVSSNKGFQEIGRIYRRKRGYQVPQLSTPGDWHQYRKRMLKQLATLLGVNATLPPEVDDPSNADRIQVDHRSGDLVAFRTSYASEGGIRVPATVLRPARAKGRLPVTVLLRAAGRKALLALNDEPSARQLASTGRMVVVPDIRCFGEMCSAGETDDRRQRLAWERNGIVWGRPVAGMACSDIRAVVDGVSRRPDADMDRLGIVTGDSGDLALAALFAASLDPRIKSVDADLNDCCFEKRNLALIPSVLQYGDVLQWAALLADRDLTLHNVPDQAGDISWLRNAFAVAGNGTGLKLDAD